MDCKIGVINESQCHDIDYQCYDEEEERCLDERGNSLISNLIYAKKSSYPLSLGALMIKDLADNPPEPTELVHKY